MAAARESRKTLSRQQTLRRAFLAGARLTLVGLGSLGRPLAIEAALRGAREFNLVDLHRYKLSSVENQCQPDEVGQLKVDVVARMLRSMGAQVKVYAQDVFRVPDGVVGDGGIVVSSVDNGRAFIGANRLALRMRARLLKLNVEPKMHCAAVRAYDLGPNTSLCGEDQMDDRHYDDQLHPRSCDAETRERPTASPRDLCDAAARLGIVALHRMQSQRTSVDQWHGWQWQYMRDSGRLLASSLDPLVNCRCDHGDHWRSLTRLAQTPEAITLRELAARYGIATTSECRIRFCQQVATRCRCVACQAEFERLRWVDDVDAPVGQCSHCGGILRAVPFWTFRRVAWPQLAPIAHLPLAQWGVAPHAVLEFSGPGFLRTFVTSGPAVAGGRDVTQGAQL